MEQIDITIRTSSTYFTVQISVIQEVERFCGDLASQDAADRIEAGVSGGDYGCNFRDYGNVSEGEWDIAVDVDEGLERFYHSDMVAENNELAGR